MAYEEDPRIKKEYYEASKRVNELMIIAITKGEVLKKFRKLNDISDEITKSVNGGIRNPGHRTVQLMKRYVNEKNRSLPDT